MPPPAGVHTGGRGHSGRHRPDHRGDHLPQAQAAARQEDGDCQDRLHQVEGDHRGEDSCWVRFLYLIGGLFTIINDKLYQTLPTGTQQTAKYLSLRLLKVRYCREIRIKVESCI